MAVFMLAAHWHVGVTGRPVAHVAPAASDGALGRGAVIGPHRGRRARRRSLLGSSIPSAVPYTVSCDSGCSASVAPVDEPVQHTLGNLPGCSWATSLRDASCARAAVRRRWCAATATGARYIAPQAVLRWFASSRSVTRAGAIRAAFAGASGMPREPDAGANAKLCWQCRWLGRRSRHRNR